MYLGLHFNVTNISSKTAEMIERNQQLYPSKFSRCNIATVNAHRSTAKFLRFHLSLQLFMVITVARHRWDHGGLLLLPASRAGVTPGASIRRRLTALY